MRTRIRRLPGRVMVAFLLMTALLGSAACQAQPRASAGAVANESQATAQERLGASRERRVVAATKRQRAAKSARRTAQGFVPDRVVIPQIAVDVPVAGIGLQESGELMVPSRTDQAD